MSHLPFPVRDANAGAGSDDLEQLPEWDLTDLYPAPDAPELLRDMEWPGTGLRGFCARLQR